MIDWRALLTSESQLSVWVETLHCLQHCITTVVNSAYGMPC